MAQKQDELEKIKNNVVGCTVCDLCFERNRIVFGEGNPDADILFLGEGPGREENETGRPFVGGAGKLLDKWLEEIGLIRADVFITNIVKCRPPNNRDPNPTEIEACNLFLEQQIDIIKPKVIVTLGRIAARILLDDTWFKITQHHGRWRKYKEIPVLPIYHPAFLLRQMSEKNKSAVKSDLQKIKEMVEK